MRNVSLGEGFSFIISFSPDFEHIHIIELPDNLSVHGRWLQVEIVNHLILEADRLESQHKRCKAKQHEAQPSCFRQQLYVSINMYPLHKHILLSPNGQRYCSDVLIMIFIRPSLHSLQILNSFKLPVVCREHCIVAVDLHKSLLLIEDNLIGCSSVDRYLNVVYYMSDNLLISVEFKRKKNECHILVSKKVFDLLIRLA